ncbi:MAG: protein kinase [Gemmatimonadetes bacterium]|nr:protein kinase [Gemmatimonadota bacterium]
MYPGPHYTPFRGCWKMSDLPNGLIEQPGRSPEQPDQIGHYKILEPLGEGGLGVVYLAEQTEPVKRQVALKLIKPGMDSKQVITRFEAERQALAVMEHPNIAQVFDGGVTERGLPYFVMELVRGLPITEYCDTHKLSIRNRLEIFIDVCHAVQHAHQKGVIHRDLKPSNILVADSEKPVPKVIDFGIAKATDQRLTEDTVLTQTGYAVGTPAYMSPEQADTSGLDIDTRTDIYSLGVILYELLSGQFPYEQKELQGLAGLYTILEREPPRPSVRYSSLEVTQRSAVADLRVTDPGALRKRLRGDLDWIILKAMEKDRDRRYETANGLATDIRRHLNVEPVVARPPSAGYRLEKFTKRNKVAVLAGGVAVLALIGGTIVETAGWSAATRRARVAESRELAGSAIDLLETHPDRALVYAIEAAELAETFGARDALRRAVGNARLVAVLRARDKVRRAAFSPDGERVVTASFDATARLWSAETGEALAVLRGHEGPLLRAAFSPDGRQVLTASDDGTARLWLVYLGDLLELAESLLPVTLTPEERARMLER